MFRFRPLLPWLAAATLIASFAGPVAAVVGGRPDGNGHPYVALILVPGEAACSGTLIDEDVVLTAGHCTDLFTNELNVDQVLVTFDPVPAIDPATWLPTGGTWYTASEWYTHPDFSYEDWPFTVEIGVVILDEEVSIEPADLPAADLLDTLVAGTGQTQLRFEDVGYGVPEILRGGGTPTWEPLEFVRKVALQRYFPAQVTWPAEWRELLILTQNVPAPNKGGTCPGDSGSGVFLAGTDTLVAVHFGGSHLGINGVICGTGTSLSVRLDNSVVLDWLQQFID
jgi:hypothetical protein